MQLFQVTVADVAAGLVPLPDERGIAGLGILLRRIGKRRIPAPTVGTRQAHALFQQGQRGIFTHATAGGHVVIRPIALARAGIDDHDLQRLQFVANACEFRFHVGARYHVTVREVAEVQLHTGLEAPFQRYLVYGDGAFAVIHGGSEVVRRIEMRTVVRDEFYFLQRPSFTVWQVFRLKAGKETC